MRYLYWVFAVYMPLEKVIGSQVVIARDSQEAVDKSDAAAWTKQRNLKPEKVFYTGVRLSPAEYEEAPKRIQAPEDNEDIE